MTPPYANAVVDEYCRRLELSLNEFVIIADKTVVIDHYLSSHSMRTIVSEDEYGDFTISTYSRLYVPAERYAAMDGWMTETNRTLKRGCFVRDEDGELLYRNHIAGKGLDVDAFASAVKLGTAMIVLEMEGFGKVLDGVRKEEPKALEGYM